MYIEVASPLPSFTCLVVVVVLVLWLLLVEGRRQTFGWLGREYDQ